MTSRPQEAHLGRRPPMMDSRLVLPLPEGPISASSSPGRQQPVTLCRICACAARVRHQQVLLSQRHTGASGWHRYWSLHAGIDEGPRASSIHSNACCSWAVICLWPSPPDITAAGSATRTATDMNATANGRDACSAASRCYAVANCSAERRIHNHKGSMLTASDLSCSNTDKQTSSGLPGKHDSSCLARAVTACRC